MAACPICGEPAEDIDRGLFHGSGFGCKTHKGFRVAASVFAEQKEFCPRRASPRLS